MFAERLVITDRVFLLGLDYLYREAMKRHERSELLRCARRVADLLRVPPADVPVEGYYAEDVLLTEYFLLARALQEVGEGRAPEVSGLPEYRRLLEVACAPLFGRPQKKGKLLPAGRARRAVAGAARHLGGGHTRVGRAAPDRGGA
jgi:hypothetical protein